MLHAAGAEPRRGLREKAGRGFSRERATMAGGGTELWASGDTRQDWPGSMSTATQWSSLGDTASR